MLALRPRDALSICSFVVTMSIVFSAHAAQMQFAQQGPKLVGTGYAATPPQQGTAVAISVDGNTIIVGGPNDVNPSTGAQVGAAWVFTRTNGMWSQQGGKLVGSGAPGDALQGTSVAISADGNTAIIGGPADDATTGAAWVFTRTNGVWSQQGPKLVGADAIGLASQGQSVSLSADGNTAIVGGLGDNSNTGAAWIFTRSNGVWGQTSKLIFPDGSANIFFGATAALSGDGNTAIISGGLDGAFAQIYINSSGVWTHQTGFQAAGAVALSSSGDTALIGGVGGGVLAHAFTLSAGVWNSGVALVAVGGNGSTNSVSLSADASTAMVGDTRDAGVWAFTNAGGSWSQFRTKLMGTGGVGQSQQGASVALSSDGRTFVVGGSGDNSGVGAVWIFVFSAAMEVVAHDFNGDGKSDLLWRNSNSFFVSDWLMNGSQVSQAFGLGPVPSEFVILGQRDFNGAGSVDLLWRNIDGDAAIWFLSGGQVVSAASIGNIPSTWSVVGTGDFNGDGMGDILWEDNGGDLAVWLMNGATVISSSGIGNVSPSVWTVVGIGDFNGDGDSDILWRDGSGNTSIWFMSGAQVSSAAGIGNAPTSWSVVGTGDFNGDGKADIAWRDTSGNTAIWLMNGATVLTAGSLGDVPTNWSIVQTGDYDGDGKSDLLWQDTSGNIAMWFMNGTTVASTGGVAQISTCWIIQSANAE
jgi:FG-GAP-like repeat